jgi:hypothetical protein
VDEIYAVGDAGFQQKCTESLLELRAAGRTVVLVTHDMDIVQRYCDRAVLIERGKVEAEGDPADVVRRYFELTLEHRPAEVSEFMIESLVPGETERRSRIEQLRLRSGDELKATVGVGEPIEVSALIEVEQAIRPVGLRLEIRTQDGARVFSPSDPAGTEASELGPGERVRAGLTIENRLSPGPYRLNCVVLHSDSDRPVPASPTASLAFEVTGDAHPGTGLVSLEHEVRLEPDREPLPR